MGHRGYQQATGNSTSRGFSKLGQIRGRITSLVNTKKTNGLRSEEKRQEMGANEQGRSRPTPEPSNFHLFRTKKSSHRTTKKGVASGISNNVGVARATETVPKHKLDISSIAEHGPDYNTVGGSDDTRWGSDISESDYENDPREAEDKAYKTASRNTASLAVCQFQNNIRYMDEFESMMNGNPYEIDSDENSDENHDDKEAETLEDEADMHRDRCSTWHRISSMRLGKALIRRCSRESSKRLTEDGGRRRLYASKKTIKELPDVRLFFSPHTKRGKTCWPLGNDYPDRWGTQDVTCEAGTARWVVDRFSGEQLHPYWYHGATEMEQVLHKLWDLQTQGRWNTAWDKDLDTWERKIATSFEEVALFERASKFKQAKYLEDAKQLELEPETTSKKKRNPVCQSLLTRASTPVAGVSLEDRKYLQRCLSMNQELEAENKRLENKRMSHVPPRGVVGATANQTPSPWAASSSISSGSSATLGGGSSGSSNAQKPRDSQLFRTWEGVKKTTVSVVNSARWDGVKNNTISKVQSWAIFDGIRT